MDKFTKAKRSEIMSQVRGKDSVIEQEVRKELWKRGFRYRKNSRKHFGTPDIVLSKHKTVVFVDSCFWHGCQKHGTLPSTRTKFWAAKIERNKQRDKETDKQLRKDGWKVCRVWEHQLKENFEKTLNRIEKFIIK